MPSKALSDDGGHDDDAASSPSSSSSSPPPAARRDCCAGCAGDPEPARPTKRAELAARWPVLVLLCLTLFGSYYVYDVPTAVEQELADWFEPAALGGNATSVAVDDDGSNTDTSSFSFRYNMLYSVYSWPNVVLPFLGGVLSDRLGVRLMSVVFMALIALGQGVTAFGCSMPPSDASWAVMWVGRTLFGFGGESLSVAASAMIAQWFSGRELAFALGANLAVARIGSVVNDAVSVQVAQALPVYWAFWVGFGVCLLSLATAVVTYYLDESSEDRLRKNLGLRPAKNSSLPALLVGYPLWAGACGCRRAEAAEGGEGAEEQLVRAGGEDSGGSGEGSAAVVYLDEVPKEEIFLSAALSFPLIFWVLCLSCVTVYIAVLPFNSIASGFIAQKWLTDRPLSQLPSGDKDSVYVTANSIMLTTYLVAGFVAPVMGGVIDRVGYRALLNLVASAAIIGVHALLGFTRLYPVGPILLLGLGYSIYAAALWPSIALVIEPRYHATAYGVATAFQNLGLAVAPMVIGLYMPSANCPTYDACVASYARVELLLIGTGCVGLVCGVVLNLVDCTRKDGVQVLNWTSKRVEEKRAENAAKEVALV